ncbi:cation:H+ antiporter [Breoghania corrubedonensis]|uniref:Cation:H+ antiporter n=1 Tax=Breoghania corrubedonensis TaxID=665038 RepID=A0A2T5VCZ4_9HYPH|nr:cation transporter [Breoghania corrubedonensis]PTW61605.1 cation:H+ antiporter [Breoghania corrubedonensis]
MIDLSGMPLSLAIVLFAVAAGVITLAGVRLSSVADELADRTGMGEVVAGALFVGAATSLPGAFTSVTAAAEGAPSLAVGNALGGLTAQTAFIAVADLVYRQANLEHAAASVTGLAQGVLLVVLIALALSASSTPSVTLWGVHPVSILIPVTYAFGLRLLMQIETRPMWRPVITDKTREAVSLPDRRPGAASDRSLWLRFAFFATMTALSGYLIGEASLVIVAKTALSESVVGTVLAGVANSLPELVTAIAAVRIGAVSLALGDIIGGNAFEVMFLCAADMVHSGSIYDAMTDRDRTTALIAIIMTGALLLGMLRREKYGVASIGFESALVLALYAGSLVLLFV